ncbi:GntR family transcriptional regulator [Halobacillus salinus]|uniref:GntR family transcriptional regulator n=1 Tax=Halobacillus salinus TaxID=192814 RepID=A0A4Z0GX33_9BACI|nr:GntR family transcriptional regulator [Halobacillus salinus]TGB01089.1 GntR family transcriptional regulator [Halobacillus salinus]
MKSALDNNRPIYLQIKESIEEDILNGLLKPEDQIPSNSQLVKHFNINPVTVLKGINLLVDEEIIYKKRGVGMFVSPDAPEKLKKRFSKTFLKEQIEPLIAIAKPLGLSQQEVQEMIDRAWKGEEND